MGVAEESKKALNHVQGKNPIPTAVIIKDAVDSIELTVKALRAALNVTDLKTLDVYREKVELVKEKEAASAVRARPRPDPKGAK